MKVQASAELSHVPGWRQASRGFDKGNLSLSCPFLPSFSLFFNSYGSESSLGAPIMRSTSQLSPWLSYFKTHTEWSQGQQNHQQNHCQFKNFVNLFYSTATRQSWNQTAGGATSATHSISTSAPIGRCATPTHVRAGILSLSKNWSHPDIGRVSSTQRKR